MGEPHVISALRDKRAEFAGRTHGVEDHLTRLRASLAPIDATIKLFAPELDPNSILARPLRRRSRYFASDEIVKRCQDILRAATPPEINRNDRPPPSEGDVPHVAR